MSWRRANETGALCTLAGGIAAGGLRLILELYYAPHAKHKQGDSQPRLTGAFGAFVTMNYLHFAIFNFLLSSAIMVAASLASKHSSDESEDKFFSLELLETREGGGGAVGKGEEEQSLNTPAEPSGDNEAATPERDLACVCSDTGNNILAVVLVCIVVFLIVWFR
jgi:hypothetical protein